MFTPEHHVTRSNSIWMKEMSSLLFKPRNRNYEKIKIVAQYRRQSISKTRELIANQKIWFWSKMSDSQRFNDQGQIQDKLRVTLNNLIWPLDHFLTENQRFEIIRLKV